MAEFTKGLWSQKSRTSSAVVAILSDSTLKLVALAEGSTPRERIANAHLIAQAPAMYEALKIARANLQFLPPDDVVEQIDAALAAAEGKQAQP